MQRSLSTQFDSILEQLNSGAQVSDSLRERLSAVLRLLDVCSRKMADAVSEEILLRQTCADLAQLPWYVAAEIHLVEPSGHRLTLKTWAAGISGTNRPPLERWDGPYWVMRTLRPYLAVGVNTEVITSRDEEASWQSPAQVNAMTLPIWIENDLLGVLVLLSGQTDSFSTYEESALHALLSALSHHILRLRYPAEGRSPREISGESELLFHALSETSTEALLLLKDEFIVECNTFALRLFRCQRSEMLGKSIYDFSPQHQPGGSNSRSLARELIRNNPDDHPQIFSWQLLHGDGTQFDAEVRLSRVELADGEYTIITLHDETTRREQEIKQALNDLRFQAVLENSSEAIAIFQNGLHRFVNPAFVALIGSAPAETYLQHGLEVWAPPVVQGQLLNAMHNLIDGQGQPSERLEIAFTRTDGTELSIEANLSIYRVHSVAFVVFIGRNVRPMRQTAAALEERNQALNTMAEVINTAVTELNVETILEQTLGQMLKLTGLDYGAVCLVDSLRHILVPGPRQNIPPEIEDLMDDPICLNGCRIGRRAAQLNTAEADGDLDDLQPLMGEHKNIGFHYATTLRLGSGVLGVLCLFGYKETPQPSEASLKVLEQIGPTIALAIENARLYQQTLDYSFQLEEKVEERTTQLRKAVDDLETFAYSVSHDIKAPLRAVNGYSHMLAEQFTGKIPPEAFTFVENIRAAAHQMDELINGLMKYSQMDRRNLTLSVVNPRQIVDILLLDRSDEIQRRAIQVENMLPPVMLHSDYESVYQAINAVIDNAFKFTRTVPAPRIEIGGKDKERSLLVWVRDNGIGFDMRFHERIYEIFQRLHRMEEYPGTGIGLAMAWKSLQKIGGSIHAESSLGVGTTFYLEIPK